MEASPQRGGTGKPDYGFAWVLALAAGFVLLTGISLPATVASHFGVGGAANGFMPRDAYLALMLALVIGMPLLLVLAHTSLRRVPPRYINLPNREYWLAPERVAETYAFLQRQGVRFGTLLVVFLCFVHGLVVLANGQTPARFPERPFIIGLILFLIAVIAWAGSFISHFLRPHRR